MTKFALLCTTALFAFPATAWAQSTGSIETEEEEIIVTGSRAENGVNGIVAPDSTKAKGVLTQEIIERQVPGQSILNTINLIPGVNYTNSDAYGSSGGNIRIRGFDGNRISLTFDGIPLNDTGNYAIFGNQQLDPELIEQVNVNLGTTDVDSPTASAAGGTVNYRTILPERELGAELSASYGEDDFHRVFGRFNTGELTSFGTRAWASASMARNDKFKGPGEIYKQQYNARIYQPLGSGGDFLSVAANYNQNRNNFYRNPSLNDLRTLTPAGTVPAAGLISSANPVEVGRYPEGLIQDAIFNFENNPTCFRPTPGPGAQNDGSGAGTACTNFFELRINPSNTGNIRGNSRFSLADNLILTVDPSFQYVLANGGGTSTLAENSLVARGANSAVGRDFNGDGDVLDTVRFLSPNTTNTRRYGLTASLIWDVTEQHRFRVAYTYDRGRHRQTGEFGFLDPFGRPENVFGGRNGTPVTAADGFVIQQRDRLSIALLNQVAGQYIGRFFDRKLRVELGLRAPFFKRELNQFCFTQTGGSGFATCTSQPGGPGLIVAPGATGTIPSGRFFAPFEQTYKFDKLLPNVGFTYKIVSDLSVFGSYAKGFSAPRTDNLYRAPLVNVDPETTNAFDLGLRYTNRRIQAQATGWKIDFKNRILTTFDPEQGISIDRNVGAVESYGFDGSIAFKPIQPLSLYVFGSYIHSEFQEDVRLGNTSAPTGGATLPAGTPIFAPTRGKMVAETPTYQFGGRAQLTLGPVELGVQGKFVDDRFATDVNDVVVDGYTLVDLDARYSLESLGLKNTYFQLNINNLFNKFYFGNIGTQVNAGAICPAGGTCAANGANPNFSVGAPRTILGTIHVGL